MPVRVEIRVLHGDPQLSRGRGLAPSAHVVLRSQIRVQFVYPFCMDMVQGLRRPQSPPNLCIDFAAGNRNIEGG